VGPPLTLDQVNALDDASFIATFGHVYEASPHLAAAVGNRRPFASAADLAEAFTAVARELDPAAVLALLKAHPQLGARTEMAAASRSEQRRAGLTGESPGLGRICAGNDAYLERFGFPFIIAVRGVDPDAIADALEARLGHDEATERAEALAQVQRIVGFRLAELVAP
jgi:2-oxo-4-hydroxy-4-carboxy-5-ureidoimidazoline decarboxylase